MAICKQCDRCGNTYKNYNFEENSNENMNGLLFCQINDKSDKYYKIEKGLNDLCPKCLESFKKWWDEDHIVLPPEEPDLPEPGENENQPGPIETLYHIKLIWPNDRIIKFNKQVSMNLNGEEIENYTTKDMAFTTFIKAKANTTYEIIIKNLDDRTASIVKFDVTATELETEVQVPNIWEDDDIPGESIKPGPSM